LLILVPSSDQLDLYEILFVVGHGVDNKRNSDLHSRCGIRIYRPDSPEHGYCAGGYSDGCTHYASDTLLCLISYHIDNKTMGLVLVDRSAQVIYFEIQ
jgi:hypothetical protein